MLLIFIYYWPLCRTLLSTTNLTGPHDRGKNLSRTIEILIQCHKISVILLLTLHYLPYFSNLELLHSHYIPCHYTTFIIYLALLLSQNLLCCHRIIHIRMVTFLALQCKYHHTKISPVRIKTSHHSRFLPSLFQA